MRISDWSSDVCSSDLLSKTFGAGEEAVHALDNVSLTIRENEFFTLLGPSGCGKTTLLRLIGGFEQPSGGEIFLQGSPLGGLQPLKRSDERRVGKEGVRKCRLRWSPCN